MDCGNGQSVTIWQRLLANRTAWTTLMVAVLVLGGAWTWMGRMAPGADPAGPSAITPRPGFLAPGFTLETLQGTSLSLADLQGKAVVLNFWATWCLPCRVEMPALEQTWLDWQDEGLIIVAVNLQESPGRVADYAEELGLTFPVLLDQDASIFQQYQVQLYPTTFFIGRDGVIRDVVFGGPMAETLIASKAAELLEE
jgi:cytochrome c biogenesis protein CcmG/thiol:disulfide interchange protein DsbE